MTMEDSGNDDDNVLEEFILTFYNSNYDSELDDAISFNRVQIDTRPTQVAYHNKTDKWRERNRIGLTNLKRQRCGPVQTLCRMARMYSLI
jgi:hypothetical protein